jgi:hypothetical protein
MGSIQSQLVQRTGGTYIAFLTRESDGALFNYTTLEFVPGQKLHLTLDDTTRSDFRIPYQEVSTGSYTFNIDCTDFSDGQYKIDSRPLNSSIEYPTVDLFWLDVEGGEVIDGALNIEIDSAPALALFCFVRRNVDSKYLKADQDSYFGSLDIPGDSEEYRSQYRIPFYEYSPGKYRVNRSLSGFDDGVYVATVYRLTAQGVEMKAGSPVTIHVLDERQDRGVSYGTIFLNHDTIENDNLRYVKPNGDPIDKALVYVFNASEYSSDNLSNSIGTTYTTSDGRWAAPIPVQAGATYTIVFHKKGYFGPDSVTVSL